jgi:hypothetical protein
MKHILAFLFCIGGLFLLAQNNQGTISYIGRVTHMYDEDDYQVEIPYEQQNTNGVMAEIYFDSSNIELDLIATIVYSLNVTYQKEKDWLLYLERNGSNKTVQTTTYDGIEVFVFDSLEFNFDTTRIIAGFSCNLARYIFAGIEYELWFCKDIHLGSNLLPVPDEIPGACMEFTIQLEIVDVKYTASRVELTAPDPNRFEMIIPNEYKLEGEPLFPIQQSKIHKTEGEQIKSKIPPPPPPIIEKY